MEFRVLKSTGDDSREWSKWVNMLPGELRDIHFLPEYGRIYEKTYGFTPLLFLLVDDDEFILQPVVKRRLNALPFLAELDGIEDYYDISNPYGYGGSVSNVLDSSKEQKLFHQFDKACRDYCLEQKIASEFISFHPLLENHLVYDADQDEKSQLQKKIVYADLSKDHDELWRNVNRGHRSSISKARKNGVLIERIESSDEAIRLFNHLYIQTMKRNKADSRWFFPEDYFTNCRDCLGSQNISVFVAKQGDQVLSMYFLMHAFDTVYYHFGASDELYFKLRPNNLLMYEAIMWAKENGFKKFHLGGGVGSGDDDSLLRFKRGFSRDHAFLHTIGRVHETDTYDELCRMKADYEMQNDGHLSSSDYFPAYRRS